jgi:hypothetical protein
LNQDYVVLQASFSKDHSLGEAALLGHLRIMAPNIEVAKKLGLPEPKKNYFFYKLKMFGGKSESKYCNKILARLVYLLGPFYIQRPRSDVLDSLVIVDGFYEKWRRTDTPIDLQNAEEDEGEGEGERKEGEVKEPWANVPRRGGVPRLPGAFGMLPDFHGVMPFGFGPDGELDSDSESDSDDD